MNNDSIDIIIISYNTCVLTIQCIKSIYKSSGKFHISITLVDNASTDKTIQELKSHYPEVKIIANRKNLGYSAAVNIGIKSTTSNIVIVSNSDVEFQAGSIDTLVEYLETHPEVGVTGPQQVFPNGRWQRSYGNIVGIKDSLKNTLGITSIHNWVRRLAWPRRIDKWPKHVGYIDGAVIALKKKAYISIGEFDENFFFYGEEMDFCFRLRKGGWKVVFLPFAQVIHIRGGSSKVKYEYIDRYSNILTDSKTYFVRKYNSYCKVKIFIIIELIHAMKMSIIYKFIKICTKKTKKEHLSNMSVYFMRQFHIWLYKLRALRNSY